MQNEFIKHDGKHFVCMEVLISNMNAAITAINIDTTNLTPKELEQMAQLTTTLRSTALLMTTLLSEAKQ